MTLDEIMKESANYRMLNDMAEKLFPGRVSIGTESRGCPHCNAVTHSHVLTIRGKESHEDIG